MGYAEVDEGAVVATAFFVACAGGAVVGEKLLGSFDDLEGESSEFFIDFESCPSSCFTVENEALFYVCAKHFFETECLRADLDFIGAVGLRFAPFVFDGREDSVAVPLYDVANPA